MKAGGLASAMHPSIACPECALPLVRSGACSFCPGCGLGPCG